MFKLAINSLIRVAHYFPFLMNFYYRWEVKRICAIFLTQDFLITESKQHHFEIKFNPKYGYASHNYQPTYFYDHVQRCWRITLLGTSFASHQNPTFELINELRGYTLLGTSWEKETILDLGSSNGFVTSFLAKKVGSKGHVWAVEPDSRQLPYLKQNLRLNRLTNTKISPIGIGSKTGQFSLSLSSLGSAKMSEQLDTHKHVLVQTYSLLDYFKKNQINLLDIRFIKIDIEGAEVEVVSDLLRLLKKNWQLVIAIASYHQSQGQETYLLIEDLVRHQPEFVTKTVFPYHATTFLIHRKNQEADQILKRLPSYQRMNLILGQA